MTTTRSNSLSPSPNPSPSPSEDPAAELVIEGHDIPNSGKTSIPKGAQFLGGKGAYFFIASLFLLAIGIVLVAVPGYLSGLVWIASAIILMIIAFDFQGIRVNFSKRKVRKYRFTPIGFIEYGRSYDLDSYHSIQIDYDSFRVKEQQFFISRGYGTSARSVSHGRFIVYFEGFFRKDRVIIDESHDYSEAKELARKYSDKIGLPVYNVMQQKVVSSRKARRARRRRRNG